MKATGVTKDEQKRALLLHVSGEEVQDIFETLEDTGTRYEHATEALSEYFKPRKHISYERHVIRHAKQNEGETIYNFIVRLSKLSLSCEFAAGQKEEMIRDQVVDGCDSTDLRRKLLAAENLTLEMIRKIARTYELSVSHASKMVTNGEAVPKNVKEEEEINRLQRKKPQLKPRGAPKQFNKPAPRNRNFSRSTAQCYRCGRSGHYGRECEIAKNAQCRKCGKRDTLLRSVKQSRLERCIR